MRVRATKDGTYGGFYREGPIEGVPGITGGAPGEVFEIDEKPYPAVDPDTGAPIMEQVLDGRGNPIIDMVMVQAVDEKGNPVVGSDKRPLMNSVQRPRLRQKMWHWFAPDWMEKVSPDEPITYEENSRPRGVHPNYKIKKQAGAGKPKALSELQEEIGKPIADEVKI